LCRLKMTSGTRSIILCLAAATTVSAYGSRWGGGSWREGGWSGGYDNSAGAYGYEGFRGQPSQAFIDSRQKILIAHGVLAALAFVLFFPMGAIMIRLGTFRGIWLVHGIFQLFAYIVYIVAFGLGIWMVNNIPYNLITSYHPIIGFVVFVLLFFQPILGFVHHVQYKKHSRRTIWSYGHLWLGRIAITLGMINGGLGMLLASNAPSFLSFGPTQGQIIAYGVVAGIMWLLWVVSSVIGERRKARAPVISAKETELEGGSPPRYKQHKSRFA